MDFKNHFNNDCTCTRVYTHIYLKRALCTGQAVGRFWNCLQVKCSHLPRRHSIYPNDKNDLETVKEWPIKWPRDDITTSTIQYSSTLYTNLLFFQVQPRTFTYLF